MFEPRTVNFRTESQRRWRSSGLESFPGMALCLVAAGIGSYLVFPEASSALSPDSGSPRSHAAELFADITRTSGLDFVHFNGMTGELYFPEMNGSGAGLFDLDNDGDLDVYLVQGAAFEPETGGLDPRHADRILRNDLGSTPASKDGVSFTDVTASSGLRAERHGMGVAAGDFDNDGWTDLYVTNLGVNQLLRNNGDGTLTDVTEAAGVGEAAWSLSATFSDFDRDGWLDLFVANYVEFDVGSHRVCSAPSGAPDYCGPLAFPFVSDRLYRNLGGGRFEDVSARAGIRSVKAPGMGVVAGDFDGDSWTDFYVANDQAANNLWINQTNGTFRDEALLSATAYNENGQAEAGMGTAAGDYDNDGDEDLFVTHLRRESNTLYRNEGSGLYVDVTRASGLGVPSWRFTSFGAGWLDFDNDGWLDLLTVSGSVRLLEELVGAGDPHPLRQTNQLFRNQSDGTFEEVTRVAGPAFAVSEVSRGAAFGDLDNDGDTDVVITNNGGPARLLENLSGRSRHWLGVRLRGATSPRDMLDAWACLARPALVPLCRRARAGGSYASSGDPRILFGLGESTAVGKLVVTWPSGRSEAFEIPGVDRYLTLREGTGNEPANRGSAAAEYAGN